jgi:hypothetical protein
VQFEGIVRAQDGLPVSISQVMQEEDSGRRPKVIVTRQLDFKHPVQS